MTPVHFNWFPTNISEQNEQNSMINDTNFKIFEPCTNMKKNENQKMNFSNGGDTCLNSEDMQNSSINKKKFKIFKPCTNMTKVRIR